MCKRSAARGRSAWLSGLESGWSMVQGSSCDLRIQYAVHVRLWCRMLLRLLGPSGKWILSVSNSEPCHLTSLVSPLCQVPASLPGIDLNPGELAHQVCAGNRK